ncbi:HPP family protein [Leucobacter sp. cx-42]|uniref:HPP family protein n=1 Tax=unclassified Leucobacter TaxID=2621730 RepID=UPI00165E0764|nr:MULTISPECIES: HPP family protein [unclassified Leucobacter]MBC9953873.1 HPP family protein [Leucobacter sp. cx-42]
MSKKPVNSGRNGNNKKPEVSPEARRKQIIVALIMGAVMGLILSLLTQFWLWLPAGLAMGLATGAIMRPPAEEDQKKRRK